MRTTTLLGTVSDERSFEANQACPNGDAGTPEPHRWLVLLAKILLPGGLFGLSLFGAFANSAKAQAPDPDVAMNLSLPLPAASNAPAAQWVLRATGSRCTKGNIVPTADATGLGER